MGKGTAAVVVGAALLAGGLAIALASRARAATPPPGAAEVFGQVTDASTGDPIAGVQVSLDGLQALTDVNGNYYIASIAPGEYIMVFSKTGYQSVVK